MVVRRRRHRWRRCRLCGWAEADRRRRRRCRRRWQRRRSSGAGDNNGHRRLSSAISRDGVDGGRLRLRRQHHGVLIVGVGGGGGGGCVLFEGTVADAIFLHDDGASAATTIRRWRHRGWSRRRRVASRS